MFRRKYLYAALLCIGCTVFLPTFSFARDFDRYQAVPMGGSVFIMDTKEGHMWLWTNRAGEKTAKENPALQYQGNVRNYMKFTNPMLDADRGFAPQPRSNSGAPYTGGERY